MSMILTAVLFALLAYHIVNIYTDVRYRLTKNLWHLLFFLAGTVFYFSLQLDLAGYFISLGLALVFGLVMEFTKITCPGDTKMCIATSIWLAVLGAPAFISIFGFYFFYLFILVACTLMVIIRNKGIRWTISNQIHNLRALITRTPMYSEKVIASFPGAVAISIGAFFQILYLYVIVGGI